MTAIKMTPKNPMTRQRLPEDNMKGAESKKNLKTPKLLDLLAKRSTYRDITKSMGHSAQTPKMDTVTVDSNHWLGWSESAPLLSLSPERYQSASYGEMSLNISHLPARASFSD